MNDPRSSQASSPRYAGDVSPADSWEFLSRDPHAQLVDVRSVAEWTFVGVPDLSSASRRPLLCEWQKFPSELNPAFTAEFKQALETSTYRPGAAIFFLCRSGARSRAAAIAMTEAGYANCFNVADGFEGGLNDARHRGGAAGWKAAGLPWIQS